jgi:YHS domain-containing protein
MSETIVLGSHVQFTDSHGGLSFLRPRLSGVVLDPQTTRLDYLIVHRGFIGGQDQCVPASYLASAQSGEVTLRLNREALKDMPPLEAKLPERGYAQRTIPEENVLLSQGTLITDDTGQNLGHFYGVVVTPDRQIERILVDLADHPGIPVDAISSCGESCIQVQHNIVEASMPTRELAAGTTVRDPVCDMEVVVDTALKSVHRGDTYYFCSLACKQAFELDPAAYAARARTV